MQTIDTTENSKGEPVKIDFTKFQTLETDTPNLTKFSTGQSNAVLDRASYGSPAISPTSYAMIDKPINYEFQSDKALFGPSIEKEMKTSQTEGVSGLLPTGTKQKGGASMEDEITRLKRKIEKLEKKVKKYKKYKKQYKNLIHEFNLKGFL